MTYQSFISFFSKLFHVSEKVVGDYYDMFCLMMAGAMVTLAIFFLTLLFAVPLALPVCMGRMSKNKFISKLTNGFLLLIRGTPLMLQLLIVYFVPKFIALKILKTTVEWSSFVAAIVAFSINYSAYFAEIYRSGIESVSKGQYEACKVLGYTQSQTFFGIVLPQAIKHVIPVIGNEVITLVKDTSLVTILSVQELMYFAKSSSNRMVSFTPLIIAGVFYLLMNSIVSFVFKKIEKKLSYYR